MHMYQNYNLRAKLYTFLITRDPNYGAKYLNEFIFGLGIFNLFNVKYINVKYIIDNKMLKGDYYYG